MSPINERYSKHFLPLESNPEVFTELLHRLGAAKELCFHDVLSLDDAELLALLPRPAYALILVLPTTPAYEDRVQREDARLDGSTGSDQGLIFFRQTINNACGLYAVLHTTCNGEARSKIRAGSLLHDLFTASLHALPEERARILEENHELEQVYLDIVLKGDTEAPTSAEDEVDFHYLAFVKSHTDGHFYQLDGDRRQPIDLGSMVTEDDMLSNHSLQVIRNIIADEPDNVNFNLMALVEERYVGGQGVTLFVEGLEKSEEV